MKLRKEPKIMTTFSQDMFDKTVKVLQEKLGKDESKEVKWALNYISSLNPELPQFVIDWINRRGPSCAYDTLINDSYLPENDEKVRQWFFDFWQQVDNYGYDPSWVVMKTISNLVQFGAIIKEDDLYYIRAPKEWDEHETPYLVYGVGVVPDVYGLTMHYQDATKFTQAEAERTMEKLRIEWDLEKVE